MITNSIWWLRLVAFIEGLSAIALFFGAMPYRAFTGDHSPVSIAGRIHGGLFTLFCLVLIFAWWRGGWKLSQAVKLFFSAVFPFGWLIYHKWLKSEAIRTSKD